MARHVDMQMLRESAGDSRRIDTDWLGRHLRLNFYLNRVAAGDRLPSVRDLAKTLRISPTTAVELYKELENDGIVETRPRSGTFLRRISQEDDRTGRDLAVFATIVRLASRLELLRITPSDFSALLLRYSGGVARQDLRFAFLASAERFELLEQQLCKRLKWRLPIVPLSPDPQRVPATRERIARDPAIRCVLTSYVYSDMAFRLAEEFHLQVIIERLDAGTAGIFSPPSGGTRLIVTRDAEFAAGIRRVTESAYAPDCARRIVVASLDEPEPLSALGGADEIFASPAALAAVSARAGETRTVKPLAIEISQATIEDLLFQYVFLPATCRP